MSEEAAGWSILEHACHKECCAVGAFPTVQSAYRSRVLAMRSERRRLRKTRKLYEIYDRLSVLPDATEFVTRDLFLVYGVPEDVREEYVRTHKVVGPGALATYDYAVIFKDHRNLTGPTDYTIRANGDIVYPLALVLTYLEIPQGKLSAAEVLQLRRRAAIDPNSAAVEAQNYMRRRTTAKPVVVVGEMNRSVRACSKTIERFSQHVLAYDEPIESLVEGKWIQMFGPNGIHDWSISAPVVRANTLRCLYRIIITMGTDVVRLLFENEMAIVGVVLVDYGDMFSAPKVSWLPCAASDYPSSICDGSDGISVHSPQLSTELLAAGERETMDVMPVCLRSAFEARRSTVLSVKSRRGNHLGNAVDIGGNALVTCTHVAETASPCSINELSTSNVSDHLHLLGGGPWESNCPVRDAVAGELAVFVFVVGDEVRFSSPTVILREEDGHLISSPSPVMGKGRSGCALFSLTDMSLLGLFTARLDDLLVSVKIGPVIKAGIYTVTKRLSLQAGDGYFQIGSVKTREAVLDCFLADGPTPSVCHTGGVVDCAVDSAYAIERVHVQSRPAATVTFRDSASPSELCRVVLIANGLVCESSVHDLDTIDSGCELSFPGCMLSSDYWALVVSELDSAVLGFRLLRHEGIHVDVERRLVLPDISYNSVFIGQEHCSLHGMLGTQSLDAVKVGLLSVLSGGTYSGSNGEGEVVGFDKEAERFLQELDDVRAFEVCKLLDYEFYLEIVGERAIHASYAKNGTADVSIIFSTHRMFCVLVLGFLKFKLGSEVYDNVIAHIMLSLELKPT